MNTTDGEYYYLITKSNIINLVYFFLKSKYEEISINMYDENQYDYNQINIHKFYKSNVDKETILKYIVQIINEIYISNPKLKHVISLSLNNEVLKIARK